MISLIISVYFFNEGDTSSDNILIGDPKYIVKRVKTHFYIAESIVGRLAQLVEQSCNKTLVISTIFITCSYDKHNIINFIACVMKLH